MPELEDKIKELPPDLRQEVEDFVQFLIENQRIASECQDAP